MYDHDTKYASTLEFTFQFKERATSMPSPIVTNPNIDVTMYMKELSSKKR